MIEATLFETPDNLAPENHQCGWFQGSGGTRLRYGLFPTADKNPRGTIILIHGRNECIEKYFETIRDLNALGFWVATYDTRGQGASQRLTKNPLSGHVRRFSDYSQDLDQFFKQVILPDSRAPYFLVAHSTGALVALSAMEHLTSRIERMILCSPFIELAGQSSPKRLIRFVAAIYSFIGFGHRQMGKNHLHRPFQGNPLTSDETRFNRVREIVETYPDLFIGPPTARWLYEALKIMPKVTSQAYLTQIHTPTLLIAPVLDKITPFASIEALSRNFRASQLIPISGARHEIFNERDIFRAQVLASIDSFFAPKD
jgi:lysophospholipase